MDIKKYFEAVNRAQQEFLKIPRSEKSGTRNGNACNAVVRQLERDLLAAGEDKNCAKGTAVRMGMAFKTGKIFADEVGE